MSAFPSLPLFTDAYIADTAHLTCEEHGAYLRLLMFAWRSPGCCLPDDDARLARMLGLTVKRWASIKGAVMAFWINEDGRWLQKRLSREHQFVSDKVEKKRASGLLGGRPKSLKNQDATEANGFEIEKQTESEQKAPTPTPINTPKAPKGAGREPEGFARWYATYDARDGKSSRSLALRRYQSALSSGATEADLETAKQGYFAELRRTGKFKTQFVKRAEFFLSPDFWPDYVKAAKPSEPASGQDAKPYADWTDDRWRAVVREWKGTCGHWPWKRSPPPDEPNTAVPSRILSEMGVTPKRTDLFEGRRSVLQFPLAMRENAA